MKTFHYVIQDKEGIHARPAGEFVKEQRVFHLRKSSEKWKSSRCKEDFRSYGTWC